MEWHAFGKMRLHTDSTLTYFECLELLQEAAARKRREQTLNPTHALIYLAYKYHSLDDYIQAVRLFGGTDGFSTQVISSISL